MMKRIFFANLLILLLSLTGNLNAQQQYRLDGDFKKLVDAYKYFKQPLNWDKVVSSAEREVLIAEALGDYVVTGIENDVLMVMSLTLKADAGEEKELAGYFLPVDRNLGKIVLVRATVYFKHVDANHTDFRLEIIEAITETYKKLIKNQVRSTGKLEQEIKTFLINYKPSDEAIAGASTQDVGIAVADSTTETTASVGDTDDVAQAAADAVAAQAAGAEKRTKRKIATIRPLLNAAGYLPFTLTTENLTKAFGAKPQQIDYEADKKKYADLWTFLDGTVELFKVETPEGLQYFYFNYRGGDEVSGLPLGLILGGTTADDILYSFKGFRPSVYNASAATDNPDVSTTVLEAVFSINGKCFVKLVFDQERNLKEVFLSNKEMN